MHLEMFQKDLQLGLSLPHNLTGSISSERNFHTQAPRRDP